MTELSPSSPVAVLGAGTMGAGIAQVAATAGHKVYLFDINPDAITEGIDKLRKGLDKLISRGKMTSEGCDALLARIHPCSQLDKLADAGLVIEAIVEKLAVKQQVFGELEEICNDDTILATNTSSISITSIGAALKKPERLVGMHFFNPAPILKLVEVISGKATKQTIAQTIYDTAKAWGKTPVFARSTPGFIVNRVARPFYAEGLRILEEGAADVATIDTIMREAGQFRMGPFELMDLIGHDVNYAVTASVFDAYYQDPRFKPALAQLELVNAGFLGRKSGRGFYNYNDDTQVQIENFAIQSPPKDIVINGDLGPASILLELAEKSGLDIKINSKAENGSITIDGITLALCDGRSATERAALATVKDLVLFDLSFDFEKCNRIVLTAADQAQAGALEKAAAFFQALDKQVSLIDDIPGMIVMRTVCMLANEAADAVHQGVANVSDVDIAMCNGVNYPRGPLQWADIIGVSSINSVLQHLQASYGEDRYRVSPLIRRKAFAHSTFY